MAKIHGKKARFWLTDSGGVERDLSEWLNSIDYPTVIDTGETSGFGTEDKTFVVGLKTRTIRIAGNNSYGSNEPDHILSGIAGGGASGTVVPTYKYAPAGSTAGYVYYTGSCHLTNYAPSSPLGGPQTFSSDFQTTGSATRTTF